MTDPAAKPAPAGKTGAPLQIAIITGEASGDRVGAQLADEIKRLRPDAALWGTGGRYLRQAGVDVIVDSSRWGVVGAASALAMLPSILRARAFLMAELLRRRPVLVVAVDAGALHLGFGPFEGLLFWLRRRLPQTRILYYFPPSSWRRTLKATSLGPITDRVATPFPWNESELRRLGVEATFVGHPLLDLVHPSEPTAQFAARHGIDPARPVVGILPGSRRQEIDEILPVQLEAADIIHRRVPGVQFLLALAPTVDREDVVRAIEALRKTHAHLRDALHRLEERLKSEITGTGKRLPPLVTTEGTLVPPLDDLSIRAREELARVSAERPQDFALTIVEDATYDVLASSDVLLITSGTATLEAAILGKAMVIVYRMARKNWLEYQFVKKKLPRFIGMPNLIAEHCIVPEFVQDAATPEALAGEVIGLLLEPSRMLTMRDELRQAVAQLGEPGGAARAAQLAIALAEETEAPSGTGGAVSQ